MKKPVLFLIFNRPDTTKQVFEAIREYQPKQLFIAADGPREEKHNEKELCEETRKIAQKVDWDCEVKTLFRNENLGCRDAVSSAIDWFFENVEDGIILEDDCLPNQSFFKFCEEMLELYKNDTRIMHISGNNLLNNVKSKTDYYFSKITHIWGWATWRKSWNFYDKEIKNLKELDSNNFMKNIFYKRKHTEYWLNLFYEVKKNKIKTWDYQWLYTIWKNNGLSITPNEKLVKNIGFNNESTNTKKIDNFTKENNNYFKINSNFKVVKHPNFIARDYNKDLYICNKTNKKISGVKLMIKKIWR